MAALCITAFFACTGTAVEGVRCTPQFLFFMFFAEKQQQPRCFCCCCHNDSHAQACFLLSHARRGGGLQLLRQQRRQELRHLQRLDRGCDARHTCGRGDRTPSANHAGTPVSDANPTNLYIIVQVLVVPPCTSAPPQLYARALAWKGALLESRAVARANATAAPRRAARVRVRVRAAPRDRDGDGGGAPSGVPPCSLQTAACRGQHTPHRRKHSVGPPFPQPGPHVPQTGRSELPSAPRQSHQALANGVKERAPVAETKARYNTVLVLPY